MQTLAKLRNARLSTQKCRLVADQVRGMAVGKALELLTFSPKKVAGVIKKVLESAIANAENNQGADIDTLSIATIYVDQAAMLKRMHPRAKGRGARIVKPTCHITIKLSDNEGKV